MPKEKTTSEERQRRREEQRARLARATEELLTSEGWRRWLRARATFHSYSLRNTLLIAQQAEERGFTAPTPPSRRPDAHSASRPTPSSTGQTG